MIEIQTQFISLPVSKKEALILQLQHFWKYLDLRFDAVSSPLEIRWLHVGGLLVKLECRNPTLLRYVDIQLACCFVDVPGEPDAVFRLWSENINDNHPLISTRQIHIVNDHVQALVVDKDKGRLYAFDKDHNTSYLCLQDSSEQSVISQGYLLYKNLYNLAKYKGRLMLHGAALGYEKKGVLICGGNGYGKSTLAVSSLLQSCQYVGDDRLMLTRDGNTTRAWPIYSIASLYDASLIQLPELNLKKRWLKDRSKHVFDISTYHEQFHFGLPIKALIFPTLVLKEKKPSFTKMPGGRVLTHLIWSTIKQMNDRRDPEHIRNMLIFLKDLPCYQLNLCSDLERNAKFLKKLILNELK